MSIKNKKFNEGFTLIEIMIAMTLFTAIMILGTGAVLQTSAVHKKAQSMRSVMDNLNFIMEDMARNLRLGSSYHCFATGEGNPVLTEDPKDCTDGSPIISFESVTGLPQDLNDQIVYSIIPNLTKPSIYTIYKSKNGGNDFVPITPDEVEIELAKSGFTVIGSGPADTFQPRVTIRLVGTVTYKNLESKFNLETTVSQRLLDI
ncbi:MAG TPA: type II secretion system protein [Candidatus Paceibacterota bacterium]